METSIRRQMLRFFVLVILWGALGISTYKSIALVIPEGLVLNLIAIGLVLFVTPTIWNEL